MGNNRKRDTDTAPERPAAHNLPDRALVMHYVLVLIRLRALDIDRRALWLLVDATEWLGCNPWFEEPGWREHTLTRLDGIEKVDLSLARDSTFLFIKRLLKGKSR